MNTPMRRNRVMKTERLYLRVPDISDLGFFIRLYTNREVMKQVTPTGEPTTVDEAEKKLSRLIGHWEEFDYGMFVIELKDTRIPVGYCGLRFLHEIQKIELGYIIDQPHWGSGIASEAAAASVRFAKDTLGADSLLSVTSPDNIASQKILLKLGFERSHKNYDVYQGMQSHFFILNFSK